LLPDENKREAELIQVSILYTKKWQLTHLGLAMRKWPARLKPLNPKEPSSTGRVLRGISKLNAPSRLGSGVNRKRDGGRPLGRLIQRSSEKAADSWRGGCVLRIAFQLNDIAMRKLFAALTKLTFADHIGFNGNVLGKYPNNRATKCRPFVEEARGRLFDFLSQSEKLHHAFAAFRPLHPRELVQSGVADLTQYDLVVVQHRKPEGSSVFVVSFDSMANQRHGLYSPRTGTTPRLRVHQLPAQINSFGGQPPRYFAAELLAPVESIRAARKIQD
jgi:hypothetical protein